MLDDSLFRSFYGKWVGLEENANRQVAARVSDTLNASGRT